MKITKKWMFCAAFALFVAAFSLNAAQSERQITFTFTGFYQTNDVSGNDMAVPFAATTKDILEEISYATGQDFLTGKLVLIESLDDEEAPSQIVVRNSSNQVDVTEFFDFDLGSEVKTEKFANGVFKSTTYYAIDEILFSTVSGFDGIMLNLQGFTKETLKPISRKIDGDIVSGIGRDMKMDVNGELSSANGFIGPVKGSIKVGPPKIVVAEPPFAL